MNIITTTIAAVALTATSVFAHVAEDHNTATVENIQDVVEQYLPFIQANGKTWRFGERAGKPRLDVSNFEMPNIVVAPTQDELNEIYLSYADDSELEGKDPEGNIPRVAAFYDPESKTMFFHGEMDLSNPYNISTIIHETIHHIQFENGIDKMVECGSRLEEPAYSIQLKYLDSVGYDDEIKIRGLKWGKVMYSSCRAGRL